MPLQLQPVPDINTIDSPGGTVSVTVTVPEVAPAPGAFDTVKVYCAVCVWMKLPLCVLVMDNVEGLPTVILKVLVAVPPPVTCTVKSYVLATVGIPLRTPLPLFNPNPAGSDPEITDQVYGVAPPGAVSVWE